MQVIGHSRQSHSQGENTPGKEVKINPQTPKAGNDKIKQEMIQHWHTYLSYPGEVKQSKVDKSFTTSVPRRENIPKKSIEVTMTNGLFAIGSIRTFCGVC